MKKSMKYVLCLIFIIIIAVILVSAFTNEVNSNNNNTTINKEASFKTIDTADNLDDAKSKANDENKSIFVVFDSKTCYYCKLLKENTLNDANVMDKLDEKYVTTIVNIDKQPDIASAYNITATPIMLLLDSNGNEQQRLNGYMGPEELLEYL